MANPIQAIEQASKLIDQLIQKLELTEDQIVSISGSASKTAKNFFDIKLPRELNEQLKQSKQFSSDLNSVLNERQNLQKKLVDSQTKLSSAVSEANRQIIKNKFETQQLNKIEKESAILSSKLATEYQKLKVKRDQAARTIQSLVAKQAQGIKLTKQEEIQLKKARTEYLRYKNAVTKADAAVGKLSFTLRNQKAIMASTVSTVRSLASAFGLTSAVFIFADIIRNAIERVREFDKEMQNLAGILRTDRKELKDVEDAIIDVASESIKTSNEVAKLATNLFTLGKSREEVKLLLKPVNDLSIALGTSSEEAGEFLVQTLNSFGAGADEAAKYADTIAGIRTSTSLDFQRMRDSFQYIAPISRLLNKDLAYTGALVGILSDNGIKAESAGRLLATSQIKLAKEGLTLNDALEQVNEAYKSGATELEILALAGNLFGKQAAKIGAVLAINTDNIGRYEERINAAGGSLKDLVNEQLKSVDANLKITESAWESLILKIDNGDNSVSKFVKGALKDLTHILNNLSLLLNNNISIFDKWKIGVNTLTKGFMRTIPFLRTSNGLFHESVQQLKEDNKARLSNAKAIDEQIKKFIELNGSLAPFNKGQKQKQENPFSLFIEGATEAEKKGRTYQDVLDDIKVQEDLLKSSTKEGADTILDKISVLEKERKAWERSNKTKKKAEVIIKDSIRDFENQIEVLRKNQTETSKSSEEYAVFEHQIQVLSNTIRNLKGDFEQLEDISLEDAFNILGDAADSDQAVQDDIDILKELINLKVNEAGGDLDKLAILFDKDLSVDQLNDIYETLSELDEAYADKRIQLQQELGDELKNLGSELLTSFVEIETEKYDERIEANNNYYNGLLENEELTDEERKQLQEQREAENKRLEDKKEEVERRAFLLQQGYKLGEISIDTAQKVAAIKANAALMASNIATAAFAPVALAQIPLVIATGAAAAASIAAQTIPAFKHGKPEGDNYFGDAWVGDGGKREVIYNPKTGSFGITPDTPTLTTVGKDDIIYSSIPAFNKELNSDQVMQAAFMTSLYSQKLNTIESNEMFGAMLSKFQGQIKSEIKSGLKSARFNIYNDAPKVDVSAALRLRGKIDV
ncbi:phage tail tape measure protein [Aquimarina sp. AU119]|uniref:phage tail tape measure protein n=1 Tax=Aquimarina sp. AU119 TaxID=2108528 RepID=UPI000D69232E|nr:phage tail tape measure protein [Aquimarina sp. AU119]